MSDPLPIGATLAGHRIEAPLGGGAMGTVYRARATDGTPVALKVLHPAVLERWDLRRRFEREARALAAVTHRNVIGVRELGEEEGRLFLAMELLEGESLEDRLVRERLDPEEALVLADAVLAGLAYAHAHGILHRDVKPDNVFLTRTAEGLVPKLLDFGLAKLDDDAWGPRTQLTTQGMVLGTPTYMAPEQIRSEPVDARADVYAMGVMLFEMLTGTFPFVSDEIPELFRMHLSAPVPSLAESRHDLGASPELETLVARALEKDRDARFADAGVMRRALRALPKPAVWST
ncbi:MAG: serine/threonine protein kinase [Sandaracinus sp.]|nr:serine/threonine protein kinase [Sandaracinus sp.]